MKGQARTLRVTVSAPASAAPILSSFGSRGSPCTIRRSRHIAGIALQTIFSAFSESKLRADVRASPSWPDHCRPPIVNDWPDADALFVSCSHRMVSTSELGCAPSRIGVVGPDDADIAAIDHRADGVFALDDVQPPLHRNSTGSCLREAAASAAFLSVHFLPSARQSAASAASDLIRSSRKMLASTALFLIVASRLGVGARNAKVRRARRR